MQISFVMLLFSDQFLGKGKSFQGGKLSQGAPSAPPVEESQKISDEKNIKLNYPWSAIFSVIVY